MSEKLYFFEDFTTIKKIPFLHNQRIKITPIERFNVENHFIATKLFQNDKLLTLDTSNQLCVWNVETGKLEGIRIVFEHEGNFSNF